MDWPVADILNDLLTTLRSAGSFRQVTIGEDGAHTDVPRCAVIYDDHELFGPDDSATSNWVRLRATIRVRTRSVDVVEGIQRVHTLCQQAADSLLADPFRAQSCANLPIGRATEVGRFQLARGLKRPEVEMFFDLRCHFELQEDA